MLYISKGNWKRNDVLTREEVGKERVEDIDVVQSALSPGGLIYFNIEVHFTGLSGDPGGLNQSQKFNLSFKSKSKKNCPS